MEWNVRLSSSHYPSIVSFLGCCFIVRTPPTRCDFQSGLKLFNVKSKFGDGLDFSSDKMQPFNKYYPPDYDGKSNINKMAGTHALGRRAHKLNQGILIVRFELPFNIWCSSCNNHIGQGVRFNAEKKRIGNYYSTPIWSFRMKCHLCSAWFEIKTDPENTKYVIVDGAKKQSDEWDTTDQGVVQPKSIQNYRVFFN